LDPVSAHRHPLQASPDTPGVLRRMRIEMGTWVAIEAGAASEAAVTAALTSAFGAVHQIAALLDPERPGSDLHRINHAPCGASIAIHQYTADVLRFAQRLHLHSAGIFDPCVPVKPGTLEDLELAHNGPAVVICHRALQLDFGGFGKGFAVDQAIAALRAAGCHRGLVNAGGDVRTFGCAQDVLLRAANGRARTLELRDAALAVSDLDAPQPPRGHRGYYTRRATTPGRRRFAAVRAPQAMIADALTKCVLLCPAAALPALLREFGGECLA
jgi:thiamine biosynthesis lipoprotein